MLHSTISMLRIQARLLPLAARHPLISLFIAISLSCAVMCAVILAIGFLVIVFLGCTIGLAANSVTAFPETFSVLTQITWRMVWMAIIVVCGFCGMFNLWIISTFMLFITKNFYVEEILPLYNLFVALIDTKFREQQAKERIRNERVTRAILEQLICADIAGEVAKFADFRDRRRPRSTITDV